VNTEQGNNSALGRFRPFGRSMVVAVLLFTVATVALLWGLGFRQQAQLRSQLLAGAEQRSLQLADAVAGQAAAIFAMLDLTLLTLRAHAEEAPDDFDAAVRQAITVLPQGLVSHLVRVDAQGYVRYNTLGRASGTYLGDRPHFRALRERDDHLSVGEPVLSRLSGKWVISVGRPLYREGKFDGSLQLLVLTDFLSEELGRSALANNDMVGLAHESGRLIARTLAPETIRGRSLPPQRPFLQRADQTQGTFRARDAVDGESRLFGWHRLPSTGVVAVIGLAESTVLSPLRPAQRQSFWLTMGITLALLAGGGLIAWLLWRLERGQAAIRLSEQQLQTAQRMARIGYWAFDLRSHQMSWSEEIFRIFGRPQDGFVPTFGAFVNCLHPDDRDWHEEAWQRTKRERLPLDAVLRIVLPDGGSRHIRLLCVTDYKGDDPVRYHGTVQDISELRETQLALQRLNAELESRVLSRTQELQSLNHELEAFTYSVSHDLRTPLRSIHGFASLLREDEADKLSPEGQDFLRRIQEGARRMGLLITDMLSMAQHSRAVLQHERVDLSTMARTIVTEWARQDPARDVHWDIEVGMVVLADPVLMRAVLQNLLGNAWKYTSLTPQAHITFARADSQVDGQVCFCVKDNGAGFDMTYADQLFQPFKRLHAHHEFEGTGIGLATVHRVIQRHGGHVWGQGQVGVGAMFCFSLPDLQAPPVAPHQVNGARY
jgi:signal transduction histidine kinase